MTSVDQPTNNASGNLREELIATFQSNFPMDAFGMLQSMTRRKDWHRWIESKLREAIFMYGWNFGWMSHSTKECKLWFRAEQKNGGLTLLLDSNYNVVRNVKVRTGDLSLQSRVDNIHIAYENEEISFSINYLFTLTLSLEPSDDPLSSESRVREIIGQHSYSQWFSVCSVPLRHLRCWMLNKLSNKDTGVDLPAIPNDNEIVYGSRRYATWFIRMIRGLGPKTIRKFLMVQFLSFETFEVISSELDALDAQYSFKEVPTPELGVDIPFAEPEEEGLTDVTAEYLERTPVPIIPPSKARKMNEAFKISINDRLRLRKLADFIRVNGYQALHLSDLGGIVDLGSKSAVSEFLKRMVQAGLITIVKAADERQVVTITQKGYDVLSAFD